MLPSGVQALALWAVAGESGALTSCETLTLRTVLHSLPVEAEARAFLETRMCPNPVRAKLKYVPAVIRAVRASSDTLTLRTVPHSFRVEPEARALLETRVCPHPSTFDAFECV